MKTLGLLLIQIFAVQCCMAQEVTISGYIRDAESGENLIGATVVNLRNRQGISTNSHGFYSLTLSRDSARLQYSYVGYQRETLPIILRHDTIINIGLRNALLDEVVIDSPQVDDIYETTRMSNFVFLPDQIKTLPALLGEVDVLKAIQLIPGVQSGNEGTTGLYVRGGGADQNLLLLDGVPIYNASHLFGFFSIFNIDAVNHIELIKGGFPARYGGRLSSVVDISMKDGNVREFQAEGSIGLISLKATVQGPIKKDKTSFIVSGRRTYADALAQPIIKKQYNGERGYYFYDLNLKLNHQINEKNDIYLSTYFGNDKGYLDDQKSFTADGITLHSRNQSQLQWGNMITAFRWNHIFGPKLFTNITTTYSKYHFEVANAVEERQTSPTSPPEVLSFSNEYKSGIRDWAAKIDFDYLPNSRHLFRFGNSNIFHKFSPGIYTYNSTIMDDSIAGGSTTYAYEFASYVEDDWTALDILRLNVGVHYSAFEVENSWYHSVQPRVSARVLLSDDLSVKGSFASMTQYIHLLTNVGIGLPTDLWVSSTSRIKPQQANQVAIGLAKSYKSIYEFSIEGYYKKMSNLIEYKDGASYLNAEGDWQDKVVTNGQGKSYGFELLLQKKTGRTKGWVGYTLSKSTRQFDQLNFGKPFPYKYDRRHDISFTFSHTWNKNKEFSMVWVFGSGYAITLPVAVYEGTSGSFDTRYINSSQVVYYGGRNSYRVKSYHRLDISYSWWKNKKWGESRWTVGIYNVYNRLNTFYIELGLDANNNTKFIAYSLFPIMPSISYSFKF